MIKKNNSLSFADLKNVSYRIGIKNNLIQGSGGNTSLKEDNLIFIKASGKKLSEVFNEDIFVTLDLNEILNQFNNNKSGENIKISSQRKTNLKPSIETFFHAIMPHKIVLHTHSIEIIANTLLPQLRQKLDPLFKDFAWDLIPYAKPGLPLAKLIDSSLKRKKSDFLILVNHGLIVGGDSVKEAEDLQNLIISRLKIKPRKFVFFKSKELSELASKITGAKIPSKAIINSLALDPWSLEIAKKNPPYPDHVVFCGKNPLVISDRKTLLNTNFDGIPYIIVPNLGVIIFSKDYLILESMLEAQAEIFLRLEPGKNISLLSDKQCDELINWEAEKYRKNLISKK